MYLEEPAREFANDLLSGRFFFPDQKTLDLNEDLSAGFRELQGFIERSKGKAVDELQEDMRDEYTRLFILPHGHSVQPYESWWRDGKLMGSSLLKAKQAYRKAGIVKSPEYPELDDHIAFELKFMHYLCEEELSAESRERLKECLNLQKAFLDDHILRWVPAFCDGLYDWDVSDFFKGIAKITKGFILLEDAVVSDLLESIK
jgi:anaerobic sulfite reductase subunit A